MSHEIIGPPKVGSQPVAVQIVVVREPGKDRILDDVVNAHIAHFFTRWQDTHVLSAPSYLIGSDGSERLYLQAVDRVLWLSQNEEQGIASARAQMAGTEEMKRLQSGSLSLVSASEMPAAPRPQRKPIQGGFGG